jgi:flavin reductase (NADH)
MNRRSIDPTIRTGHDAAVTEHEISEAFRHAMARLASGVTILAVRDEDETIGMTASAVTSVSVDPPLILVCVGLNAAILPSLKEVGRFTVNLLGEGAQAEGWRFSQQMPSDDSMFEQDDAVLRNSIASLACVLHAVHPGGDHEIVVGRVERVVIGPEQPPLVYHDRRYRKLA